MKLLADADELGFNDQSEDEIEFEKWKTQQTQVERAKIMKAKCEKEDSVEYIVGTLGLNHFPQPKSRQSQPAVASDESQPKKPAKKSRTVPPQPRSKPRIASAKITHGKKL